MSIITSFLLKKEKDKKFKEFESKWVSDPNILKMAKAGWLTTRGGYLIQQNQVKEAINDFKEVLTIDPETVDGYTSLIGAYAIQKDYLHAWESLRDCKKIIDKSTDEKVKIRIMDFYFLTGMLSLDEGDRANAARSLHLFLIEEKTVTKKPVWKELLKDTELMQDSGLIENTNVKSLADEHKEHVKFAKETLGKLIIGMNQETREAISKLL